MTEYWVSNKRHWCELCRCWLADNPQSIAHHERATTHQEKLKQSLIDMRKRAEQDKKDKAQAALDMAAIEKAAAAQWARDQEQMKAVCPPAAPPPSANVEWGVWTRDEGTGYLYNAVQRYYYDDKSGWYYGGEPVEWTQSPKMDTRALFKAPAATPTDPSTSETTAAAPNKKSVTSVTVAPVNKGKAVPASGGVTKKKKISVSRQSPASAIGGYQLHHVQHGTIGGAKGMAAGAAASKAGAASTKSAEKPKKALTPEEEAAIAKREAARARVAKRTAASFGML